MLRTVEIIDAEIRTIKASSPNWFADAGDKALITALTVEKNQLAQQQQAPGNFLPTVNSIESRPQTHILFCF